MTVFTPGQTVRCVRAQGAPLTVGKTYVVKEMNSLGTDVRLEADDNGNDAGWMVDRFEPVETGGPVTVGARVRVDSSRGRGVIGNYNITNGMEGVVVRMEGTGFDTYDATYVNFDGRMEREDAVFNEVLVVIDAPEVETLESFKEKMVTEALARAASNGHHHVEQVETLLRELAGYEFWSPSPDLDSFKKRVVEFAMVGKKRHQWCPEPENFLRSIGLGDLIPVEKVVKVTTYVTVLAEPGETDRTVRARAASAVTFGEGAVCGYVDGTSIA